MSTLKADTIQSTSGGAATLTKQAAAKAWLTFYTQQATTTALMLVQLLTMLVQAIKCCNFTDNFQRKLLTRPGGNGGYSGEDNQAYFAGCNNTTGTDMGSIQQRLTELV